MKPSPLRTVLAFYGSDEVETGGAFDSLDGIKGEQVYRCSAKGDGGPSSDTGWTRYAALRMDDESLIMVRATPADVQATVQQFQRVGSPAVFVLSDSPDPPGWESVPKASEPVPGEDFARACARARGEARVARQHILPQLRRNEVILEASRSVLAEAVRLDHVLTAAAEWLLDNGYLIRTQIAEIRRHLPRRYHQILPASDAGDAYIHELARELTVHANYALDENNIQECLGQYQEVAPLTIAELWSFPLLLRVALVEALTRMAARISRGQELREAAYFWANRLAAGSRRGPQIFAGILQRMEAEAISREPYFLTTLAEQLQDEEEALAPLQHWIEEQLGLPLTDIVRAQHSQEAGESVSTANAFGSLRALARIDFTELFESVSLMEAELRADPGGIYPHSDFDTRDRCRRVVERISRHSGMGELDVARRAVTLAAQDRDPLTGHVAYYLIDDGVLQLEAVTHTRVPLRTGFLRRVRRHATPVYLSGMIVLTLGFTALALTFAWDAGIHQRAVLWTLGALALFPLSELAVQIVNALVISLLPPEALPEMDFRDGIPPEQATLVVVPMMLSSVEVARREVEKLEVRFLANRERNLFFSLFSDFTDASEPTAPGDGELLEVLRSGIAALNARCPDGRFLLFHRDREWSESEQKWIGRERKRGKIHDLNEFLSGEGSPEILREGSLPMPIRSVITLDSDTQLPPGAARRMIETIAHPLNRVVIDPVSGVRRRGYTIIQPRVGIALPGATATRFTRVFADTSGTDPYCQAVSDAQQDLFREGIFYGKAIYDLHAFRAILGERFPAETLLSHDLIEGSYAGVGLATGIELFENLPLDYASYSQRQHRWIRGDWQIAPWIFGRVPSGSGGKERNPLSTMGRWRIFDNLRRCLVPVASLLLLLLGWLFSRVPGVWSLVVGLAVAIPAITPLLDRLARVLQGAVYRWRGAADELLRAGVMLAFLPHQAWLAVDAMARVVYRRFVSHRNLLEWQTAESTWASAHKHAVRARRQMWTISCLSLLLLIGLRLRGASVATAGFVFLWIVSPGVMRWLSRMDTSNRSQSLTAQNSLYLRRLARKTWRFFDDLVGAESHWLPPDNSQLSLHVEVAARTSPTNIGLWLTSALAAHDLGYLTSDDLLARCSQTMATMNRLERYEGHLLNWYDTNTLAPLAPHYVSTVDSGNLTASLWVLEQGCQEIMRAPLIDRSCLRGLTDTISVLMETCGHDSSIQAPLAALRRLFRGKVDGHGLLACLRLSAGPMQQLRERSRWPDTPGEERSYWLSRLTRELNSWIKILDRYLHWMETLTQPPDSFLRELGDDVVKLRRQALRSAPSLFHLATGAPSPVGALLARRGAPAMQPQITAWLDQLAGEYQAAKTAAEETVASYEELLSQAKQFSSGINMGFLYDKRRRLFGIGYLVGSPREFTSHYDLLASECRLASLVAIAKGEAPIEHWSALSRPHVYSTGQDALLSWTGTMFEYLMPLLFTRTFSNSLLDWACSQAVKRQIEYGREQHVPWGVSESAYSALDANQVYQYRAFGVPALALKQEQDEELVVAPYATALALAVDAGAATENLRTLEATGLGGPMGLYEAIDYTRQNRRDGELGVLIYAYMAHHQGMSLVALDNVLHGRIMQRRFHADLRIRAIETLLFERIPVTRLPLAEKEQTFPPIRTTSAEEPAERVWDETTAVPRVHLQGNGRYSLMVTSAGGGYSRWNDFDITRWRSDTTLDPWGSFLYIRDLKSDAVWSAAHQPVAGQGSASAHFSADRADFHRDNAGVDTVLEVTVSAEDDVELRRLIVVNRSLRNRYLEFTSYAELALAPHGADKAHPAFSKMFVETEYPEHGVLLAHRRARSPEEPAIWVAHVLIGGTGEIQFETDRAQFLGRGCTPATAESLRRDLSGSAGTVIDPVFSLRCNLLAEPRTRIEISFLTMAASSREGVLALVHKFRQPESVTRAFEMAWTRAQLAFRFLGIGPAAAHRFQDLASHLIYPNPRLRMPADRLSRNRLGQSALWRYGISGDLPMIVVTVAESRSTPLIRELLLAQTYWRTRGFRADLIIFNQESSNYDRPLHQQIQRQIEAHAPGEAADKPGGVYLRNWHAIPNEDRELILAAASVVLSGTRGPLQQQLVAGAETATPPLFAAPGAAEEPSQPLPFLELPYFNGIGGFTPDGREYAIYLKPGSQTPSPWVNVMAHEGFGTMVSESGLGCTWAGNSQSNRLTPWHNDPTSDPQSEAIYIRDEESGAIWTPTALPIREADAYRARHGQGVTTFEHNSHAIGQELSVFVPLGEQGSGDPVKVMRLRLRNDSSHPRRLTVTFFSEWLLGSSREDQAIHVQTSFDRESGAVLAGQFWNGSYTGQVAFAASSPRASSYSGDRTQILGRNGSLASPAALGRVRLDNRTGAGLDPAAALQVPVTLAPAGQAEVTFLLGQVENVEAARQLTQRYRTAGQVQAALEQTHKWWDTALGTLEVHTPLHSADFLLNRWLLYQSLSCRFWGRTALYQSSGAFGFRDQLQDCMAFFYAAPQIARSHILASASRQFPEGDVQHWWHADTGNGVRTRCSDDMLWLPFVVARYVEITGDAAILDEQVAFLEGPALESAAQEKLFVPTVSTYTAPLWNHCQRAIDHAAGRLGAHGLPLMGSGDWNDGMNRVGSEGRGESVWVGWFLCAVLENFARVMESRDPVPAAQGRALAVRIAAALEQSSWDGEWYLRAFFDNGVALGSHTSEEARIDSLPQSWAVISQAGDPARARRAMESAEKLLVDEEGRLVRLFTPPFDHSQPHPGYIMGYPPGLRENGGQYTHGSLWMAMAWARLGEGGRAVHLLKLMNPVELSRTPQDVARYRSEPYILAADVYSASNMTGRGGWTWYTGSAAWMYRIWIEEVLGFQLRGDSLTMNPALPADWPGFSMTYRHRSATYQIEVITGDVAGLEVDGRQLEGSRIHLVDDGATHHVTVHCGESLQRSIPAPQMAMLGEQAIG